MAASPRLEGLGRPLIRAGLRDFLDLDRFDVCAVVIFVIVAFGLRIASPIYPDVLSGGGGIAAAGVGYPSNSPLCARVPVGPPGVDAHGQAVSHTDVRRCGMMYDEVFFPVDAAKDLRRPAESYFSAQPPLAKTLMAPAIAAWGFNTWTWRASSIFFGSLLVGMIYLIARRLRRDRFFAVAAAAFMCFDGLAFVESRTGLLDTTAVFFLSLVIYLFLLHWQARTRAQWRGTMYVLAAAVGLAFASKSIASAVVVVALGLIAVRGLAPYLIEAFPWLRRVVGRGQIETVLWRNAAGKRAVLHYAAAAAIAFSVFCAAYSRYLTVEQRVSFVTACDPAVPGETAHAVTLPVPVARVGPLRLPNPIQAVYDIYENTAASLQFHVGECHGHPSSSPWYSWPVIDHPVAFYRATSGRGTHATIASITNLGNPAVWWPGIIGILFCAWRMSRGPKWWRIGVSLLGAGSVIAMILLYAAAVRYHAPNNPDTAYTASQFTAAFHRDPTAADMVARVSPSPRFTVAFIGAILFCFGATLSGVVSGNFVPAFIVLGYTTSWIMWAPGNEHRVLFLYEGFAMLVFATLGLAYVLTAIRRTTLRLRGRSVSLAPVAYAMVAVVIAAFVFFYPIWTAMPLSQADHAMRVWLPTWSS